MNQQTELEANDQRGFNQCSRSLSEERKAYKDKNFPLGVK